MPASGRAVPVFLPCSESQARLECWQIQDGAGRGWGAVIWGSSLSFGVEEPLASSHPVLLLQPHLEAVRS